MNTLIFRPPHPVFRSGSFSWRRRPALGRAVGLGRTALCALLCAGVALVGLSMARAQEIALLTSLGSFGGNGAYPVAGLAAGSDGNFYGTTSNGGDATGDGTIYQVTPAGGLTTLYTFTGGSDGSQPYAGLVQDSDGSFYGTTSAGGDANGDGTVYKVTPAGGLTTLYTFTGGNDGSQPQAGLAHGTDGNFYGTTAYGGANGDGTIFKLTPTGGLTTLYTFTGGSDGSYPVAGLVQGNDGNFYGTASAGGDANGDGTIYKITPAGTFTVLYTFGGSDGYQPVGKLTLGSDGNFYGAAFEGGTTGDGTIYQVTPAGALTTLYTFTGGSDGSQPYSGLVQGSDGSLYGETSVGGAGGNGTIFKLTPAGALTTLYTFSDGDGAQPQSGLVQGGDGGFYGTTSAGGANGAGTVFKLSVTTASSTFFAGEVSVGSGVYFLTLSNGNPFGYYSYLSDPSYLYHFDLGWEYAADAADGKSGVYLYDFASDGFFYTSPTFPFPYLYDFKLNSTVYYYPDPDNAGHYTTNPRYFYDFASGEIITK